MLAACPRKKHMMHQARNQVLYSDYKLDFALGVGKAAEARDDLYFREFKTIIGGATLVSAGSTFGFKEDRVAQELGLDEGENEV